MRKEITLDDVKRAYRLAKDVYEEELDIKTAEDKLTKNDRMSRSSARGYLRVFQRMMEGECYTRGINKTATRHFLEMIHADFSQQTFCKALSSVKQHTKYYKSLRPRGLPAIEKIYEEFYKKYIA